MSDRFNLDGSMDWVDCSIYLMFAYAHFTDWKLDEKEIEVIQEKAELFVAHMASWDNMPYTDNDITKKMKKSFDWYCRSSNQSDEMLLKEIEDVSGWIKDQEWFNPTFAQNLVDWLTDIAKADGKVINNERGSIQNLAQSWGVSSPV